MNATPPPREPEPSFGPDEEGDVPIEEDAVIDDPASWVHVDPAPRPGEAQPQ